MQAGKVLAAPHEEAARWIAEMMSALPTDDARVAFHALRAGLRPVRDGLPLDAIAGMSARMPLVIRGLFFEGWRPARRPPAQPGEVLAQIHEEFAPRTGATPQRILAAVIRLLRRKLTADDYTSILLSLPHELTRQIVAECE